MTSRRAPRLRLARVAPALLLLAASLAACAGPARSGNDADSPAAVVRDYLQALQDQSCDRVLADESAGFRQLTLQAFGGHDEFCAALRSHRRNKSFSVGDTTAVDSSHASVEATVVKVAGTNQLAIDTVKEAGAWKVDRVRALQVQAIDLYMNAVTAQIAAQLSRQLRAAATVECSQSGFITIAVGDGVQCSYRAGSASGEIVVTADSDGGWSWQRV